MRTEIIKRIEFMLGIDNLNAAINSRIFSIGSRFESVGRFLIHFHSPNMTEKEAKRLLNSATYVDYDRMISKMDDIDLLDLFQLTVARYNVQR